MYLSLNKKTDESGWLEKAQSIIDQYGDLLDDDSLLLLSHLYNFKPGEIKAREDNGDEEGIFMSYKIDEDVEGCFKVLQKYGQSKPQLYKMMLEFIVSKREIYEKVNYDDIQEILQQIKKFKLLDPLELINLLNGSESNDNEFVIFGIVKDYLLQYFTTQEQEITNNEKLIEMYEHDSTKNSYKLSELTHPFVIQNNKCSACQLKLDFPWFISNVNIHSIRNVYHLVLLPSPQVMVILIMLMMEVSMDQGVLFVHKILLMLMTLSKVSIG